tara:strand:+ start:8226 stop:8402 length:177 start_codon:yes stop_codon:yes gene_type:complete
MGIGDDMKVKTECNQCEAMYVVEYELDKDYYKPKFCAFCGEEFEHLDDFEMDAWANEQ